MSLEKPVYVTYTTVDKKEVADSLAMKIIQEKLGACVQIHGIESVYMWQGKVNKDKEFLLVIKHPLRTTEKLYSFLEANHLYDLPEIITVETKKAFQRYSEWVEEVVSS